MARDLRDYADRDYIATRVLARNECMEQFGYYMQQTLEKYFKSILLFHHIKSIEAKHSLKKLLNLCSTNIPYFDLSHKSTIFLKKIYDLELIRYPDFPFTVDTALLFDFDYTVKELRFFADAKSDYLFEKYSNIKQGRHKKLLKDYISVPNVKRHFSGHLEKILKDKSNKFKLERSNLVWNNFYFGSRKKGRVKFTSRRISRNNHMFMTLENAKEMAEALKDLMYFPKGLLDELNNINKD